jgi:hypothetical protein
LSCCNHSMTWAKISLKVTVISSDVFALQEGHHSSCAELITSFAGKQKPTFPYLVLTMSRSAVGLSFRNKIQNRRS